MWGSHCKNIIFNRYLVFKYPVNYISIYSGVQNNERMLVARINSVMAIFYLILFY